MKNKMKIRMKNTITKRVKLKLDYQISNTMIDTCDLKLHGIHALRLRTFNLNLTTAPRFWLHP